MQRLAVSHHHIIGDVDNIIDRAQADRDQFLLQPLGAFLDFAAFQRHSAVAQASFGAFDFHGNRQFVVIHRKRFVIGSMQDCLYAVAHQISVKVARHSPMRTSIRAIGGDVDLNQPIAFQVEISSSRHTDGGIFGQHHDTIVSVTHSDLVFRTNHAVTLDTTELRFFDHELLVSVVEFCAERCHDHFLSCRHIMCTADNLSRFIAVSQIYSRHMHVVRIGVYFASQHLSDNKAFQSSTDGLNFFDAIHFESDRSQCVSYFLGCHVEIDILFQPLVRYIHRKCVC